MPVVKCPDCGKVISLRFPIHNCILPTPILEKADNNPKNKPVEDINCDDWLLG